MILTRTLAPALLVAALAAPAHAEITAAEVQAQVDSLGQIASAQVRLARQGIAVGPLVGGSIGTVVDPSETYGTLTFGLGVYTFDVPTVFDIKDMIRRQVETRLKERIKTMVETRQQFDERELLREIVEGLRRELLGEGVTRKTLQKPSLGLVLEVVRLMGLGDGWGGRLTATKGVGPVSLGLGGGAVRASGNTIGMLGVDLTLRLTPTGGTRTPVFEVFARGEYLFDESNAFAISLGGRVLLDLL